VKFVEKVKARAKEQLVLPKGKTPAGELGRYKRFLKGEAIRLKKLHRSGGLGREVCAARAAVIDALLQHLLRAALDLAPLGKFRKEPAIAVIALGGYGRGELNPHSDVDIQFLCEDRLLNDTHPHVF